MRQRNLVESFTSLWYMIILCMLSLEKLWPWSLQPPAQVIAALTTGQLEHVYLFTCRMLLVGNCQHSWWPRSSDQDDSLDPARVSILRWDCRHAHKAASSLVVEWVQTTGEAKENNNILAADPTFYKRNAKVMWRNLDNPLSKNNSNSNHQPMISALGHHSYAYSPTEPWMTLSAIATSPRSSQRLSQIIVVPKQSGPITRSSSSSDW